MEILSEKVRYFRLQRNWTQQHLADASNLSLQTVERIEKFGNASQESVMSLCAVFEIEKKELSIIPTPSEDRLKTIHITKPILIMIPALLIGLVLGLTLGYFISH